MEGGVDDVCQVVMGMYDEWVKGLDDENYDIVAECAEALTCIGKHAFYRTVTCLQDGIN